MGEAPTNLPTPFFLTLWLIRRSPAVSEAAMVLFIFLSGLSLTAEYSNHGAIWYRVGVAGTVLTLCSLIYLLWPVTSRREGWTTRHHRGEQMTLMALAVLAAALVEFVLVVLVPRSVATAIPVLAVAQPVLVGAVALVSSAFSGAGSEHLSKRRRRSGFAFLGLVGMVITCGAMAAWIINVIVVSPGWLPARWPSVLIAMAVLTGTVMVCAPGIIRRT